MRSVTQVGARAIWLKIHLYLGLFAGALFALLGLTGSLLVFSESIDTALNPQLAVSAAAGPTASADDVIAAIERKFGLRPYYLQAPTESGPFVAFVRDTGGPQGEVLAISVNPAGGRILGNRRWGGYFISFIRELHENLLLEDAGAYITGAVSIFALASILTGLYLWWPRAGSFRRALTFHRRSSAAALNLEIHRLSGFYLAGVLFVIALTGTYLALPGPFTALVDVFLPVAPAPVTSASQPRLPRAQPLSLSAVERVVAQHTPGAVITGYALPATTDEAYAIFYRDPAEPYSQFGRSALWVDQYDGRVLDSREYVRLGAADRFFLSQVLLHNGQILGLAGRWLVFMIGLAIPAMYGTGFYIWWRRRARVARR